MTGTGAAVAIVGGGITGLIAAYRLRQQLGPDAQLTVLERGTDTGGKLRTVPLAGGPVDVGAEAFIARRPEVPALLAELGLEDQLVHPSGARPLIWSQSTLHPLPAGTLMGIPATPEAVAGLVDEATRARIAAEATIALRWDRGADVDVATLVGSRFGEQVVRRSVDPLLGGVYSGLSDTIGVRAALPTLAAALDRGAASLTAAVREALRSTGAPEPEPDPGPVFGALRGGYGVLLDAVLAAAQPEVRRDTEAGGLRRDGDGWWIDPIGHVDGVLLAVPAPQLAGLLAAAVPAAAAVAARVPLASSVVVALALPGTAELPQNSGILVATGEDLGAKAFTLSSRKWPHLAARDVALVRASFGRFGDAAIVDAADDELIALARTDLATVTGVHDAPVDAAVQRWHGGLPQYGPGHLDIVASLEHEIAWIDGLEIAGALLHGVGVPACAASGTAAATRLAAQVAR